jgi:hypothetical protein
VIVGGTINRRECRRPIQGLAVIHDTACCDGGGIGWRGLSVQLPVVVGEAVEYFLLLK